METTVFVVCVREGQANDLMKVFKLEEKAEEYKKEYLARYLESNPKMEINIFEELLN